MPPRLAPTSRDSRSLLLLRARVVVPMAAPPIADGAVLIDRRRIAAVGRWRDWAKNPPSRTLDLGEVALLPGLVNAHCHLDYTGMAGQFPPPQVFTDWLRLITSTKAGWNYSEYATSWLCGAQMLLSTGTTTVGDIEAVPTLLPEVWEATPLRVLSFLEMIGITGRRPPAAILQEAIGLIESLQGPRQRLGLSPHAPYTTLPELLRLSAQAACPRRWRVAVHVAESALEFDMFTRAQGEMYEWMKRSGRDLSDCGSASPIRHLERCGLLGENLLAVHVNYLAKGDASLLAKRHVHVVHCPRSHTYFRHGPFPWRELGRAGVNVCLGTDSLASVYKRRRETVELSMVEEMRALAQQEPWLSPREIVQMATLNGARALGLRGKAGALVPGAWADLITIPFTGRSTQVCAALLQHRGPVAAAMIDGQWEEEAGTTLQTLPSARR